MKSRLLVIFLLLMSAQVSQAANLTRVNVDKVRSIIREVLDAYGGEKVLASMDTILIENKTVNIATGQSLKPEPPWDRNPSSGTSAVDFKNKVFVTRNQGTAVGFEFNNGTIINGEDSYQLDYRAGTVAKIAKPDFDTASGPFIRVTPALLVRTLQDRAQNAYYLGETTVDDQVYDVIGFSMTVGPALSLYFERESRLLRRSERVLPNFGLVEYHFSDYQVIEKIPFNREFALYLNGDLNIQRQNIATRVNIDIDNLTRVEDDLKPIAAIKPDALSRQQIADGVYLIGGNGTYAMFVEMEDHVIAVGGAAGIPERIESLREVVPDKALRYGVITHHHFDHVLGVTTYEDEGATILASRAHEKIVMDKARDPGKLKLELVKKKQVLKDRGRRVEIIDIGPTAHTEHLLIAYLPAEGIVFEADHFSMPQAGPVPPAVSSTKTFARALKKHRIKAHTLLSAHSPRPGKMEDLQEAIGKKLWTEQ